jgi:formate hydrogenlyase subunit 3/multisubunit Na+/H+ antiporter MnhD subunit
VTLLVAALASLLGGGLLALAAFRSPWVASIVGAASAVVGCSLGEVQAIRALRGGTTASLALEWDVPYGHLRIGADPLSTFFLVALFGIGAVAAVYGAAYLSPRSGRRALGPIWLSFNVFLAAMALVVVARQAVLFVVAWEVMSLASYVLVSSERASAEVARASLVYLIASHIGAVLILAFFLLLGARAHGFDFDALGSTTLSPRVTALLLVLALVGFGIKAGLVPLHVWLPEAHAAAPSHVSALMSAVLIKVGLYGILRSLLLLREPVAWIGPPLVAVGLTTALVGIALASYQRDLKRALAYSSIENMGIIVLGFGAAFWAASAGRPALAALAATGALLHVWNHALMKSLMFLVAGSVVHATGTRDLERLGGVLRRMPRTGTLFVFGSVAIAGLPPLNGFVGEWLVYLGLIGQAQDARRTASVVLLLAVGGLCVVGALALFTFVRLVGMTLLGQPRDEASTRAHESSPWMVAPMAVLAALCGFVALWPQLVASSTASVTAQLLGPGATLPVDVAPLRVLAEMNAAVLALAVVAGAVLVWVLRSRRAPAVETWACGYARPTARMQYTARSFSELLDARVLPRPLQPRTTVPVLGQLLPAPASLSTDCADPVTRGVYEPLLSRCADRFARLRWMQQGLLHLYVLYILFAVVALLGWVSFRSWSAS